MSKVDKITNLSGDQLQKLLSKVKARQKDHGTPAKGPQKRATSEAPLSFSQERFWFLQKLDPGGATYNLSLNFRLSGPLDVFAVAASFGEIVQRHEILRAYFEEIDGTPFQKFYSEIQLNPTLLDLTNLSLEDREICSQQYREGLSKIPFDLTQAPLLRIGLLRLSTGEHLLSLVIHHVVFDGWSVSVFMREFLTLYQAKTLGSVPNLEPLPLQYADFAAWQRTHVSQESMDSQRNYWESILKPPLPILDIPLDHPRPSEQMFQGGSVTAQWPRLVPGLRTAAKRHGATVYMVVLAAFKTLLHRYTQESDLLVGTPVTGRNYRQLQGLVGPFINTLVIRTQIQAGVSFSDYLGRVKDAVIGGTRNQDIPFEKLVAQLQPERDLAHTPLFQVLFNYKDLPPESNQFGLLKLEGLASERKRAQFDLNLEINESGDDLFATLEYDSLLFERRSVEQFLNRLKRVLNCINENSAIAVSRIPLMDEEEQNQVLKTWNPITAPFVAASLQRLFENQVQARPDSIALQYGTLHLSYAALNAQADQLASLFQSHATQDEARIGIFMERSPQMVVSLLASLKSGGAYVPIDPDTPLERFERLAQDIAADVWVTTPACANTITACPLPKITLNLPLEQKATLLRPQNTHAQSAAYIIYTSGSTGLPKGVIVGHAAIVNRILWMQDAYPLAPHDRVLQKTPYTFDVSVWEFFWPLSVGASLVVAEPDIHKEPHLLMRAIERQYITTMHFVPSMLSAFVAQWDKGQAKSLRQVFSSGEALRVHQASAFALRSTAALHNLYGPTEAAVDVSFYPCIPGRTLNVAGQVPIGKPIQGTCLYILDRHLMPCPIGMQGELFIGGVALARGYHGQFALTAERFMPSPFDGPGQRLYRTGDRARYLPDGNIAFLGRVDHQVKLRGLRIEPGEIEAVLEGCAEVAQAAVQVLERHGDPMLAAAIVPSTHTQHLAQQLHADQVGHWREVYQHAYQDAEASPDPFQNTVTWNNSFDGLPFSQQEMTQWLDSAITHITSFSPKKVLEIGCGTGMIFFKLLPQVDRYLATDFSQAALDYVRHQLMSQFADHEGIEFLRIAADQCSQIGNRAEFDTVIFNSVVQYFPSVDYLTDSLTQAMALTTKGGRIFLGDLRHFGLAECFAANLSFAKSNTSSAEELLEQARFRLSQEEELTLGPRYFAWLQNTYPRVKSIILKPKRQGADNELTKYRYDAVLILDDPSCATQPPQWHDWRNRTWTPTELESELRNTHPEAFGISHLPNGRLAKDVALYQRVLQGAPLPPNSELDHSPWYHPDALAELAQKCGYQLELFLNPDPAGTLLDIVFFKTDRVPFIEAVFSDSPGGFIQKEIANCPLDNRQRLASVKAIRAKLSRLLPDYMQPAFIIPLSEFPMTRNGKLDRRALQNTMHRNLQGLQAQESFVAPRTPLETHLAELWCDLLGLDRVGIYQNFFEIGGHSLLATKIIARLLKNPGVEVSLKTLFKFPTIATLAEQVQALANQPHNSPNSIPRISESPAYPLSPAQKRLWFIELMSPGNGAYNIPLTVRLRGSLKAELLAAALVYTVERHESLRTRFVSQMGVPEAIIEPQGRPTFLHLDLSAIANPLTLARTLAGHFSAKPFHLETCPLMRAALFYIGKDDHILTLVTHHIVSDGQSMNLLIEELITLYQAFLDQKDPKLPELPLRYVDYAAWQNKWLESASAQQRQQRWQSLLSQNEFTLNLPADRPRPLVNFFRGAALRFPIPTTLAVQIKSLSHQYQTTGFMTYLAAFQFLLHRYSGQSRFLVGSPIAGRNTREVEPIFGFFVNTLPIPADLHGNPSFAELLDRVKQTTLEAFDHQDVPFEKLVEDLQPERDPSRNPLFQVAYSYETASDFRAQLSQLQLESFTSERGLSHFDLSLFIREIPMTQGAEASLRLHCTLEYSSELFDDATINRMQEDFLAILDAALLRPQTPLAKLQTLPTPHLETLLYTWNQATLAIPSQQLLHHYLEQTAQHFPDAFALFIPDPEPAQSTAPKRLTYGDLNAIANGLAHRLIALGVGTDQLVALEMHRNLTTFVALIAILKAGAGYLPLDSDLPAARRKKMLEMANARLLLLPDATSTTPNDGSVQVMTLAWDSLHRERRPDPPACPADPASTCVLLYTSGSTGEPKGIFIPHSAYIDVVEVEKRELKPLRTIQFSALNFDVSLQEIFTTFAFASELVVPSDTLRKTPHDLPAFLIEHRIERIFQPFAALSHWVEVAVRTNQFPATLQDIVTAGEPLRMDAHLREFLENLPHCQLRNQYGPTETIMLCEYSPNRDYANWANLPPVGRPFPNTQFYLLDHRLNPVPLGTTGEIFLGGNTLARGYAKNPRDTAHRFVPNPYAKVPGARIYRSGDLGRYLPNGDLQCLGRVDFQFKFRGFRIEPGEIETLLCQISGVDQALVKTLTYSGNTHLGAYLSGSLVKNSENFQAMSYEDSLAIQHHLSASLPEYMIPTHFICVTHWPRTSSGKIHRKSLPLPKLRHEPKRQPVTALETLCAEVWGDLLGQPSVGLDQNFFALGGHSLLVARMVAEIQARTGRHVPVRAVFDAPTLGEFSHMLDQVEKDTNTAPLTPIPRNDRLQLSFSQQRLWFLYLLEGPSATYNMSSAFRLRGPLHRNALEEALRALLERHEPLRTSFHQDGDLPYQTIHPSVPLPLVFQTIPPNGLSIDSAQLQSLAANEAHRHFHLEEAPLLRLVILELGTDDHALFLTIHHIISDGWSLEVFIRELLGFYRAVVEETPFSPVPLPLQYADVAHWQRQTTAQAQLDSQRSYWQQELLGVPPLLDLPTDLPRPPKQSYRGATETLTLDPGLCRQLKQFSQDEGVTLFMTLLASVGSLLASYSGQEDVPISFPVANRDQEVFQNLIGFFINTLVLRCRVSSAITFRELVQQVRQKALEAQANQDIPFEQLIDELQPERSLSYASLAQIRFVMINRPQRLEGPSQLAVEPISQKLEISKFDQLWRAVEIGDTLTVSLEYNRDIFVPSTAQYLLAAFERLLKNLMENPDRRAEQAPLLGLVEQKVRTPATFSQPFMMGGCFVNFANYQPHQPAIVEGDTVLTYGEWARLARRVAGLLNAKGVGIGDRVGLLMHRSADQLIAIQAILTLGAAYIPLDPSSPATWNQSILTDAAVKVVIYHEASAAVLPYTHAIQVNLESALNHPPLQEHSLPVWVDLTAYVIYTSGTSGQPKGVEISHRALSSYVHAIEKRLGLGTNASFTSLATVAADLANTAVFGALATGRTLHIYPNHFGLEAKKLEAALSKAPVDCLKIVPSHLWLLLSTCDHPEKLLPRECLVLGGESADPALLKKVSALAPSCRLVNHYGPTETCIGATTFEWHPGKPEAFPIGQALLDYQTYVVNSHLQAVLRGARGKLVIGGPALAKGYVNAPRATAVAFLPNPFGTHPGERLYDTGDQVRQLATGDLEYLGRLDAQVKVRGFRIELSAIVDALHQCPGVSKADAFIQQTDSDDPMLVAFIVPTPGDTLDASRLRDWLGKRLPTHYLPHAFGFLSKLPLTANGKIDRHALPKLKRESISQNFAEPLSEDEKTLAAIWRDVLKLDKVGTRDNFFRLGGDSILGTLVVARAIKAGIAITPTLLFEHPTIEGLVKNQDTTIPATTPSNTTGPFGWSPVQTWFFETYKPVPQRWNQALLLEVGPHLNPEHCQAMVDALMAQHPALRLALDGPTQTQRYVQDLDLGRFTYIPCQQLSQGEFQETMMDAIAKVHERMDVNSGHLFQALYFDRGSTSKGRWFMAAHHWAVDALSWRIILEDLNHLHAGLAHQGTLPPLPQTTSWDAWLSRLKSWTDHPERLAQVPFWENQAQRAVPMPMLFNQQPALLSDTRITSGKVDDPTTHRLLHDLNRKFSFEPNHLLLCALAIAFRETTGQLQLYLEMESHGREPLFPDLNTSRTVGWFTSLYPLLLEIEPDAPLFETLLDIKDRCRTIPNNGIAFGALRYLSSNPDIRERLAKVPSPAVRFNYLGRLDRGEDPNSPFSLASEPLPQPRDPNQKRAFPLDILAFVKDGKLQFHFTYDHRLEEAWVSKLSSAFTETLQHLSQISQTPTQMRALPSDFPDANITKAKLSELQNHLNHLGFENAMLEWVGPPTPMQSGMLFHSQVPGAHATYVSQRVWDWTGPLQLEKMRLAWELLATRHAMFRSFFGDFHQETPLLVVVNNLPLPWVEIDLKALSNAQAHQQLETLLRRDREQGFDIQHPPLMRITIAAINEESFRFIWSRHHAVIDGWSTAIALKEVMTLYFALLKGKPFSTQPPAKFETYAAYLNRNRANDEQEFWQSELRGFESLTTPVPPMVGTVPPESTHAPGDYLAFFDTSKTKALQDRAQALSVTPNTVIQGAWALLLHFYNRTQDVLFGMTVNGRPPEIPGIDQMIGLFINSIPIRVSLDLNLSIGTWLKRLHLKNGLLQKYELTPLSRIQQYSSLGGGTPLFDHVLVFENYPVDFSKSNANGEKPSISAVPTPLKTNFAATLEISIQDGSLKFRNLFDPQRLSLEGAKQVASHFFQILDLLVTHEGKLKELPFTKNRPASHEKVDSTRIAMAQQAPLVRLFEENAQRTPDAVAVVAGNAHVTYTCLNQASNLLSVKLQESTRCFDQPIAVCMERSPELLTALLAIQKAGAFYLPLDPDYPHKRLSVILQETHASLVLCHPATEELVGNLSEQCWTIANHQLLSQPLSKNPQPRLELDQGAYLIFTSGSTGTPKGSLISHRAISNRILWMDKEYPLSQEDRILQKTNYTFDVSVWEFFWPLIKGATLVLAEPQRHADPTYLSQAISSQQITILHFVPSVLKLFLDHPFTQPLASLRMVFASGEALPQSLAHQFHLTCSAALHNLYGPTEAAVDVSYHPFLQHPNRHSNGSVAIGLPIDGVGLHVMDPGLSQVPDGVAGELFIGGVALARCYFGQPRLTAMSFLPDPFTQNPGGRLYRTGDLVFRDADGVHYFLNRLDHQIKLRGLRLELGDIQQALESLPTIDRAVVLPQGQPAETLIAWYTSTQPDPISHLTFREALKNLLPGFAIPTQFVKVSTFPLTPSGKLDRKALPRPDKASLARSASKGERADLLAALWCDVLKTNHVDADTNFFEQGGHSLLATQLVSRIRHSFDVELPIAQVFETPTFQLLQQALESATSTGTPTVPLLTKQPRQERLPLSFAQQRLYFISQLPHTGSAYNMPVLMELEGLLDFCALQQALTQILTRHEPLRTTFALDNQDLVQVISDSVTPQFTFADLTQIPTPETLALATARTFALGPIDLHQGPVFKSLLLKLQPAKHLLVVTMHHIVCDGWSLGILVRELSHYYQVALGTLKEPLPELPVHYADYAIWQRQWFQGSLYQRQLDYWLNQLKDLPDPMPLPNDFPRPAKPSTSGSSEYFQIPTVSAAPFQKLCLKQGASLYMGLHAAFAVTLSLHTGGTDLVIGTDVANRNYYQAEQLVGFFVNQLVIRTQLKDDPSFLTVLNRSRQATLEAYTHQDMPFETLVSKLSKPGPRPHSPLFQVKLVLQNTALPELVLPGLNWKMKGIPHQTAKFDILLSLEETPHGLVGTLHYNDQIFKLTTVRTLLADLKSVICLVHDHPEITLSGLRRRLELQRQQHQTLARSSFVRLREKSFSKLGKKPVPATSFQREENPL